MIRSIILGSLTLTGVALVLYLSWLPQPKLGLIGFMPAWLADWTDASENDTLRTGVPFVILGIILGNYIGDTGHYWYQWVMGWVGLVTIVFIAEAGQLLLPNRSFDWLDIAWGAVGALLGMGIAFMGNYVKTMFADL